MRANLEDLDGLVEWITEISFAEANKLRGLQMLLLSILTLWDHDFTLQMKIVQPKFEHGNSDINAHA